MIIKVWCLWRWRCIVLYIVWRCFVSPTEQSCKVVHLTMTQDKEKLETILEMLELLNWSGMSDNHRGLLHFESHETRDEQNRISHTLIIANERVRWDEKGSIRDLLLETEMQLLSPNPGQNHEDVNIVNHESEASLFRSDLWKTALMRNTNIRKSGYPFLLLWSSWVHRKTWSCEERHWRLFMMEKMFSVFSPLASVRVWFTNGSAGGNDILLLIWLAEVSLW